MHRRIQLGKGAILWEKGDLARNIAVLEKGRLAVYLGERLLGVCWPRMVLGESALLTLEGEAARRTATVVADEDDTQVSEYPPAALRQAVDAGPHPVPGLILTTLVGLIAKDCLLVLAAHAGRPVLDAPLRALVQSLASSLPRIREVAGWEQFLFDFRFLYDLRDHAESMRARLVAASAEHADAVVRACEKVRELFQGQDIQPLLEGLLSGERT